MTPDEFSPVLPPADVCARLAAACLLSGAYSQPDPEKVLGEILQFGEAMVTAQ